MGEKINVCGGPNKYPDCSNRNRICIGDLFINECIDGEDCPIRESRIIIILPTK